MNSSEIAIWRVLQLQPSYVPYGIGLANSACISRDRRDGLNLNYPYYTHNSLMMFLLIWQRYAWANTHPRRHESEKQIIPPQLTQSSSLTLGLHQAQDVVLSDWALDVSDNGSGRVLQELNSDLGDTTSGTGSTQNLDDLSKSNWSLSVLETLVKARNGIQRVT